MIVAHISGLPIEESLLQLGSMLGTGSLLFYEFKRRRPRLRSRQRAARRELEKLG